MGTFFVFGQMVYIFPLGRLCDFAKLYSRNLQRVILYFVVLYLLPPRGTRLLHYLAISGLIVNNECEHTHCTHSPTHDAAALCYTINTSAGQWYVVCENTSLPPFQPFHPSHSLSSVCSLIYFFHPPAPLDQLVARIERGEEANLRKRLKTK